MISPFRTSRTDVALAVKGLAAATPVPLAAPHPIDEDVVCGGNSRTLYPLQCRRNSVGNWLLECHDAQYLDLLSGFTWSQPHTWSSEVMCLNFFWVQSSIVPGTATRTSVSGPKHAVGEDSVAASGDREIEKFIIRQPPIGEKDDYDSER